MSASRFAFFATLIQRRAKSGDESPHSKKESGDESPHSKKESGDESPHSKTAVRSRFSSGSCRWIARFKWSFASGPSSCVLPVGGICRRQDRNRQSSIESRRAADDNDY
jgi:hypothetical protein